MDKLALYFGCWERAGHYLRSARETISWPEDVPGLPWTLSDMDGGLLTNGGHADEYDGKVFWTAGGRPTLWLAFVWWDNSIDRRTASNSGFYVRGFGIDERQAAFDYAASVFPKVVERQRQPLILQP